MARCPPEVLSLDVELEELLAPKDGSSSEAALREIGDRLPTGLPCFNAARAALSDAMAVVAEILSAMWEDERYVRAEFAFDDG